MPLYALIRRHDNNLHPGADGKPLVFDLTGRAPRPEDMPAGCDPGAYFWTNIQGPIDHGHFVSDATHVRDPMEVTMDGAGIVQGRCLVRRR